MHIHMNRYAHVWEETQIKRKGGRRPKRKRLTKDSCRREGGMDLKTRTLGFCAGGTGRANNEKKIEAKVKKEDDGIEKGKTQGHGEEGRAKTKTETKHK